MNRQLLKLPLYTLAAGVLTRLLIKVLTSLALHSAGAWAVYLGGCDILRPVRHFRDVFYHHWPEITQNIHPQRLFPGRFCLSPLLSPIPCTGTGNAVQRALRFAELLYVPSHRDFHTDHGPADAILL